MSNPTERLTLADEDTGETSLECYRVPEGWCLTVGLRAETSEYFSVILSPASADRLAALLARVEAAPEPTAQEFAVWLSETDNPPCDVRQALKLLPVFLDTRQGRRETKLSVDVRAAADVLHPDEPYLAASLMAAAAILEAVAPEREALLRFADRVIEAGRDGDVDGGDVQEWATEAGLLVPERRVVPCTDGEDACVCAEFADRGETVTCYRLCAALAVPKRGPEGM